MILVNIYINDSEYNYNKNFIIQGGKEEKQKILEFKEQLDNLDSGELEEKFGEESTIIIMEQYIENNFKLIKFEELSLEMY